MECRDGFEHRCKINLLCYLNHYLALGTYFKYTYAYGKKRSYVEVFSKVKRSLAVLNNMELFGNFDKAVWESFQVAFQCTIKF